MRAGISVGAPTVSGETTVDELDKPVLNEEALWEFLYFDEGLTSVTRRSIKMAVINREIVPTRIGCSNYFSKRDGLDWVTSRKQPVPTRFVGANAGRGPNAAAGLKK